MTDPTAATTSTPAPAAEDSASGPGAVLAGVYETAAADPAVRVQDDLFRHVNGTWLATAQIPADRPSTGSFTALRDAAEAACREIIEEVADGDPAPGTDAHRIGAVFSSFMDEERIESLGVAPLEADLDGVLGATTKDELARAIGALSSLGFMGVVDAEVEVDLNDPDRYTTWMGQSGLGLPDESYYHDEAQAEVREAYVAHVAAMLDLAGLPGRLAAAELADADPGATQSTQSTQSTEHAADTTGAVDAADAVDATALAARVMAVETALAAGHWDRVTCRDIEKMNNPMGWDSVVACAPTLPWAAWRAGIGAPAPFLDELIVCQPDYLPHAARVWESMPLTDLRAWAAWHVVHARAALLPAAFVQESFAFYGKRLQGTDELRPRWKRGVGLVEGCLGEALGRLYTERHFPASHKAAMEKLVGDLIEAYRTSISALEWMGPETRERALDKLAQFTPKIGYPVRWRDYSALEVVDGDLLASVRAAESFEERRQLAKMGTPVDRDEWHMTPQTVNAYYNPTMNEIVFPAAILQPPFFDPEADDAVNYAGIGAVIGHEIGHGFDDQGSTFDGTGKVVDWWTDEDRAAFKERTGALIAQYDAYVPAAVAARHEAAGTAADQVPHVNGALTIGENIGDLGGLGIAFKAYALALGRAGVASVEEAPVIDGLTGLQRFFYSWARIWRGKNRDDYAELLLTIDPHSPAEFRCNGIVRNVDAFYETFDLTASDALWLDPAERVTIW